MKQILRLSFISALFMLCGSSYAATDVKFDFDGNGKDLFGLPGESSNEAGDGDFTEAKTATIDGVSVTVSAAAEGATNPNRMWSKSPKLRMYSGTLTIAAPEGHKITAIVINQGKWNNGNTADKGTLTSEGWSGSESSVVITIAGNTQLKDITVTLDGEGGGEPGGGDETNYGTAEAPLTVAQAIAIANAAGTTATTEDAYTKGVVTKITTAWNSQYNNVSFNISDDGGTTVLAVYRCKSEAADYVLEGDEVVIKGKLKMYNDTPEYDAGCEIISLVQGEGHNTQIETPTADNIAAFIAMESGQNAILTLKDAQVIGVGNKYMVVKDATGALNLYNTNLEFTLGQILNGTITGQTGEYKSIKQLSNMTENTLTATDGTITAMEITVADAAAADILSGPWVIKNAVVEQDGNNFYIVDGETRLQLYNQFRYEGMTIEAGTFDIEGIVGNYNNIQFWPNKISVATGIQNMKVQKTEGAIYNLAGQRVEKATKGIYIQDGKKFIVK